MLMTVGPIDLAQWWSYVRAEIRGGSPVRARCARPTLKISSKHFSLQSLSTKFLLILFLQYILLLTF